MTVASSRVRAFLALGSNLGARELQVQEAIARIALLPETQVGEVAPVMETPALLRTATSAPQPAFINTVMAIETALPALELLARLKLIEHTMGRPMQAERWSARVIDIDILLYGDAELQQPGLTVPHPEMLTRRFVIAPLAAIAPDLRLSNGRTASAHLLTLPADAP